MKMVDLNCDLGESFGNYKIGMDEQVLPWITSANIACGFHASDPVIMDKTVRMAAECGVKIGALKAFCAAYGVKMQHVKPHGALYNMADKDEELAMAVCRGIRAVDEELILLGPGNGKMVWAAKKLGLKTAGEVFADRAYMEDGSLVPRTQPGAMIEEEEEAIERVLKMVQTGTVTAITGKEIPVKADSVCVHGDGEKALLFVQKIKKALDEAGIATAPMSRVIGECYE